MLNTQEKSKCGVCCFERENPHRCISCCQCGKPFIPQEKEEEHTIWCANHFYKDKCTCHLKTADSTESFEEENENKRKHKEYVEKMYEIGLVNFISSEREKVRQEVIEKIKLWKKNNYFTDPTTNEEVADEILKNLSNK